MKRDRERKDVLRSFTYNNNIQFFHSNLPAINFRIRERKDVPRLYNIQFFHKLYTFYVYKFQNEA